MDKIKKIIIVEFILKVLHLENGIVMSSYKKCIVSGELNEDKKKLIIRELAKE